MSKIVEGVWDCRYCGAKKIRGAFRDCPSCGHPRDKTVKFYLDNPNNFVDNETAEKLNKNPDWVCRFCECLNSDDNTHCVGCGAERTESCDTYFTQQAKNEATKEQQAYEERERLLRDALEQTARMEEKVQQDVDSERYERNADFPPKRKSKKRIWVPILSVLLALVMIAGIVWLCLPKNVEGIITDFSWERQIAVEEYKTVRESDWSLPPGATYVSEQLEIKSYVRVLDHYETKTRTYTERVLSHYETKTTYKDMGNGYFQQQTEQVPVYKNVTKTETYQEPVYRNDPVYAPKYTYDIDKWVYSHTAKSSGDNHEPMWPELHLKDNQRQGTKSEKYHVLLDIDGEAKSYSMSYDEWVSLQTGQSVKLKVDVLGHATLVDE